MQLHVGPFSHSLFDHRLQTTVVNLLELSNALKFSSNYTHILMLKS